MVLDVIFGVFLNAVAGLMKSLEETHWQPSVGKAVEGVARCWKASFFGWVGEYVGEQLPCRRAPPFLLSPASVEGKTVGRESDALAFDGLTSRKAMVSTEAKSLVEVVVAAAMVVVPDVGICALAVRQVCTSNYAV